MSEKTTCTDCMADITTDAQEDMYGQHYCDECGTAECIDCGQTFGTSEVTIDEHGNGTCETCMSE